jgi:N6-L-threonylcarbamoyladenine synthase
VLILGIESSCDETAAAVVERGEFVRASVVASQTELHAEYAGVVPEIASRAHVERMLPTIREALAGAGVGLGMIDAVAVGHRPGLIGSLLVGVSAAKALAWSLGRPLIGVDHVHAHLYSGMLRDSDQLHGGAGDGVGANSDVAAGNEPIFPALGLVVSGGHTSMYLLESWTNVSRLGATIDDAIGEAFDKVAAVLKLPFPGGPNLDRLARTPDANPRAFDFPISRIAPGSLDFSFSGLKTAVLYAARGVPGSRDPSPVPELTPARSADIAASFQRAAVEAITLKLKRALEHTGQRVRTLVAGGGVTANSLLRTELASLAARHSLRLVLPPPALSIDNGAMIAGLAYHLLMDGQRADLSLQAVPTSAL